MAVTLYEAAGQAGSTVGWRTGGVPTCSCMFMALTEVCETCRADGHTENADLEDYRNGTLPAVYRLMHERFD